MIQQKIGGGLLEEKKSFTSSPTLLQKVLVDAGDRSHLSQNEDSLLPPATNILKNTWKKWCLELKPPEKAFVIQLVFIQNIVFSLGAVIHESEKPLRSSLLGETNLHPHEGILPRKFRGVLKNDFFFHNWFQTFFLLSLTWGEDPIWPIFFKGVETTN